jgi:hypothetical protein
MLGMINSFRASYHKCIGFLACLRDELDAGGTKGRLGLSRYSYEYTLNKLLRLGLVAYERGRLRLTEKGVNVLRYSVDSSARHDVAELKIAQQGF